MAKFKSNLSKILLNHPGTIYPLLFFPMNTFLKILKDHPGKITDPYNRVNTRQTKILVVKIFHCNFFLTDNSFLQ